MPDPTVILTWQEKESSDEGQTVPLIIFWFTDGSVCLSKAVGFDRLSLFITTILRGPLRAHYRPACAVRWGFPRGVVVHYSTWGEKRKLFLLVDHGGSNPVVDINELNLRALLEKEMQMVRIAF